MVGGAVQHATPQVSPMCWLAKNNSVLPRLVTLTVHCPSKDSHLCIGDMMLGNDVVCPMCLGKLRTDNGKSWVHAIFFFYQVLLSFQVALADLSIYTQIQFWVKSSNHHGESPIESEVKSTGQRRVLTSLANLCAIKCVCSHFLSTS